MKKRLIALMAAVCLVVAPMSMLAEETDYAYLEDMSVKELKALRDAINEILGETSSDSSEKVTEEVFNNAKTAYEKLVDASEIGIAALNDIYDAWYYGIYYAEQGDWDEFCKKLDIPVSDLEKGIIEYEDWYQIAKENGQEDFPSFFAVISYMDDFWSICVDDIVFAYMVSDNGYDVIEKDLNDAKSALKVVGDEFSDYKYYPNLKEFYSTMNSLYEFISNPTGSFETLAPTQTEYETKIRNFKSDLGFIFEEK